MTLASRNSLTSQQALQLSPTALAYIGDGVYELWARIHFLFPQKQMNAYHTSVVACVRAEHQATLLSKIEATLTDAERDIVRRGRNSVTKTPKRLDHVTYRYATGLEALIGYLYLTNAHRLDEILNAFAGILSE